MNRRRPVQLDLPLPETGRDPVARAHIALGGRIVEYTIRRSRRRRSITLTIDERGLRVGAPWSAAEQSVVRQINRHAGWVLRKLEEWARCRPSPRRWQDGESLVLQGESLRLTVLPHPRAIERCGQRLLVGCAAPPDPARVEREVTRWLHQRALTCFAERVAHYGPELGVPPPDIRLSNARTRWGSCHPAGYIHLNWRLVHFPLPLLDYVVVHELAHLRELNHSARFWRIVAAIIPDHLERRAEIRARAHEFLAG